MKNKKGQNFGMITGLVFGIIALIIAIIIAFVIVGTLNDANLIAQTPITITNESGFINITGYTVDGASDTGAGGFTITTLFNGTDDTEFVIGNATISSVGVVSNTTNTNWPDALISYTYSRDSVEKLSTSALSSNFTSGVNNVSSKIPTVLLIAAIILILGILAVLVTVWQRMRMGQNSL